jgi:CheY-like chemotaxis protein
MPVAEVRSPERLLDRVALYLHLRVADLPEKESQAIGKLYENDSVLAGRTVLVVDDDIRNIFALTSVLERHHMNVLSAETGESAIATLKRQARVDAVLMDIMMPEMDGYDTISAIRSLPAFRDLPIVAVTAKAMKGDREKSIEAGAWDYLAKPVDPDQLVSVLRAWLQR